jgi:hypothetical protein
VHFNVLYESTWLRIILAARVIRVFDRVLGDGFITRNTLAIAEGFEEEKTIREAIDSTLSTIRKGATEKSWKKNPGFSPQNPNRPQEHAQTGLKGSG